MTLQSDSHILNIVA